jgi:hypothetical protein
MMDTIAQRQKMLDSLKGIWISKNDSFKIVITFSEHIPATGDGFMLPDCKKTVLDSKDELFRLNFYWTNDVLRVFYTEKQCVVCFIENKMNIGFFKSILTCSEIKDDDLIIRFEKLNMLY